MTELDGASWFPYGQYRKRCSVCPPRRAPSHVRRVDALPQ